MNTKKIATVLLGILLWGAAAAQDCDSLPNSSLSLSFSYVGDGVGCAVKGRRLQGSYLGLVNAQLGLNTQAAGWWRGGELHLNLANTHGGMPSDDFVGDFQGVSNIEAGNRTFFQELWFCQSLGRLSTILGIQDMNAEFSVNESGATFINSSFGLHSTFSDNMAVSVYPITGLGGVLRYCFDSVHTARLGIFDGNPGFMSIHPDNFASPFEGNDGFMAIGEYTYNKGIALGDVGAYRFGFYYHSHNEHMDTGADGASESNYGFYFIGNQRLASGGGRCLDGFLQLSYSPVKSNTNQLYAGAGVVLRGLAARDCSDELGLAVGYAHLHGVIYQSEKVVELTYRYSVGNHIYLQPDLQYVINPSRFGVEAPNALVGLLRVGISL
jgi:porin